MSQLRAATVCAIVLLSSAANAQDLPRTHLKGIGETSTVIHSSQLEQPFWQETIPAASGGMVTGEILPFDQAGVDNAAVLRLLKLGGMDLGTTDLSRLAADDPRFEGCDLAGLSATIADVRAACAAYRPVLDRLLQDNWNAKLLYIGIAQQQVFWCRTPIGRLADLKGKKVRVYNKTLVDFLDGVGATGVSIPFPEVVPSLQTGVIDCGVTGTLNGNTAGWGEVTTHQYMASLGWGVRFTAINLDSWNRLDPKVQAFLVSQYAAYEDKVWDLMTEAASDADHCNTGQEPCKFGKLAKLTLVPVNDADAPEMKRITETVVLKNWAARCGVECTEEWNSTVGKALGYSAKAD